MKLKATNTLQSVWIYLLSIALMLYTPLKTLFLIRFTNPKNRRAQVDQWIDVWAKQILHIVGVKISVNYATPIQWDPNKTYMILSNHSSHYDIPLIYRALPPSIRMVAKKELASIPFFGAAMRSCEFIFIDRSNRKQAIQDLETAKKLLKSGIKLWMSPEGTRSTSGKLLPFKKGPFMVALQTQAIIIPVGIKGASRVLKAKSLRFHLNQPVEINVGSPIDTSNYSEESRDLLIRHVRDVIAALSGEELSENG